MWRILSEDLFLCRATAEFIFRGNKLRQIAYFLLGNALIGMVFWLGIVNQIAGAMNLALFWSWLYGMTWLVMAILAVLNGGNLDVDGSVGIGKRPELVVRGVFCCMLVWNGCVVTGLILIFGLMAKCAVLKAAKVAGWQ